jgi:hypothetical protein
MAEGHKLLVGVSGATIVVDAIRFHNQKAVDAWQTEFSEAQVLLGEFSTGLGFWGSLGFVAASAAALGMLEHLVTKASQKRGIEKLSRAMANYRTLASRGTYIPIADIENIETPDPTQWSAFGDIITEADLAGLEHSKLVELIEEFGVTGEEIEQGFALRLLPRTLSILPGEFLSIRSSDREIWIRWSEISSYELSRE